MSLPRPHKILKLMLVACALGALIYVAKRNLTGADQGADRLGEVKSGELIQRVTLSGTVEPARTSVITAPYDGYVKKLFVKLGQVVRANEPLLSVAQSLQANENVFPIRAPFEGTVTQVLKSEGQFAKQNDPKEFIVRLDDLTRMFIHANVPEIDVTKLRAELAAEIRVSAVSTREYHGVVRLIAQSANAKEQYGGKALVDYLVKIEIKDPDGDLKPGMSAVVDVITNRKDGVLTLEHEFIAQENGAHFVTLKSGERRTVTLGLQNESAAEVTSGLRAGDRIRQVDFLRSVEAP